MNNSAHRSSTTTPLLKRGVESRINRGILRERGPHRRHLRTKSGPTTDPRPTAWSCRRSSGSEASAGSICEGRNSLLVAYSLLACHAYATSYAMPPQCANLYQPVARHHLATKKVACVWGGFSGVCVCRRFPIGDPAGVRLEELAECVEEQEEEEDRRSDPWIGEPLLYRAEGPLGFG